MNGHIYAYITCTRVKWECEDEGCEHYDCMDSPQEERGWIDRAWNSRVLHDSRNDVAPTVACNLNNAYDLHEEVKDALEWLPGGYEDNGEGTFYASDNYQPFGEAWDYSYTLHFVEKFYGNNGWAERPWLGVQACLKNAGHNPYPHRPGTLYDCQACEEECFCDEGEAGMSQCIYCAD